jgi:hypothetical protein
MGGSNGGFFSDYQKKPDEMAQEIRSKEEASLDTSYDTGVSVFIKEILGDASYRDSDQLERHLATISDAIHADIDGTINLRYGGSVAKHTYVDGLSDIDTLAVVNESELADKSPSFVKDYFKRRLQQRLPNTEISIGNLAITLKFTSGFEIQILPAVKEKDGIKIPSSRRKNEWSHIVHPEKFALALRFENIKHSGKLVPVIKLAKSIISSFPEKRQLSGYHIEALAIQSFNSYQGEKKHRPMLKYFFSEAAKHILKPILDKTGQSVHVDSYLGVANSLERKMASDSLSTVARRMQNADGSREIRIWKDLLNY